ncbi:MAG: leucine-rich repeat domain-containing protein [Verrucomicrobiia bacterium]
MKTALCLTTAAFGLAMLSVSTAPVQAGDFTYITNNGTLTIWDYTGPGGDVSIPSEIDGLPVTTIGSAAFTGCVNLISITIPDSVTSVEGYWDSMGAFHGCYNLKTITIGKNVTNIGMYAFSQCRSLSTITIPASVTSIGPRAFEGCSSLTAIAVDENNPAYSSVGAVLFNKSQTTLVEYAAGKAGGYTIPNSVTSIDYMAFRGCTSLTSVTIPNSVTSIGTMAFTYCTSLTNVTMGNSVTSIWFGAFSYCTRLRNVTIPKSVTSVEEEAFYGCTNLSGAYFEGNAPARGSSAFSQTPKSTIYYLPGTTGWGTNYADRPTALWVRPYPVILTTSTSLGVKTNGFAFTVSWATNASVVVETSTSLTNPVWSPVLTNALTEGVFHFDDPQWKEHPTQFYRVRSQ